jgi:hypothetical protein
MIISAPAACNPASGFFITAIATQQPFESPSNTYRYDCNYPITVQPAVIATLPYLRLRANVTITGMNAWFAVTYTNNSIIFK